jgi:hypothetical protein
MLLSLWGQRYRFFGGFDIRGPIQEFFLDLFINIFFVNSEGNIPTYFNAVILLITSVIAFVIAAAKHAQQDKYRFEWSLLAFVFLYLSIDEAAVIHEQFSKLFKDMPDYGGLVHYKWLYAGVAAIIVLAILFIRFYLHLDKHNKIMFPLATVLYLFGAFGGEVFSGRYASAHGTKNIPYTLMTHGEEFLEHVGIALMIYTLLRYLFEHYSEINIVPKESSKTE